MRIEQARPRIIVTTSHRPSQRLRSFAKDLATVLPYAIRINRGKSSLRDLYFDAYSVGALRVVIIGMWKGNPGTIRVYEVQEPPNELKEITVIRLAGVALRREIPGARKIMGARAAAIDVRELPLALQHLADTFTRAFFYKIIFSDEEASRYDVIARASLQNGILEMKFLCKDMRTACGPKLRIVAVEDYVSGFRLYRDKALFKEASREHS